MAHDTCVYIHCCSYTDALLSVCASVYNMCVHEEVLLCECVQLNSDELII